MQCVPCAQEVRKRRGSSHLDGVPACRSAATGVMRTYFTFGGGGCEGCVASVTET